MTKVTQEDLIKEYYTNRPNQNIEHKDAVDWLTLEYKERTGRVFRDPDRAIRKLSQSGFLKEFINMILILFSTESLKNSQQPKSHKFLIEMAINALFAVKVKKMVLNSILIILSPKI